MTRDLIEVKRAAFTHCQLTVKHHFRAINRHEFLGHFVVIAGLDGIHQFVDFLDGVPKRMER